MRAAARVLGCTSRGSVVALLLTLAGCAAAIAGDVSGTAAGPTGIPATDAAMLDYLLGRYGPWASMIYIMIRAIQPIDKLAQRIDRGEPLFVVGHQHVVREGEVHIEAADGIAVKAQAGGSS